MLIGVGFFVIFGYWVIVIMFFFVLFWFCFIGYRVRWVLRLVVLVFLFSVYWDYKRGVNEFKGILIIL